MPKILPLLLLASLVVACTRATPPRTSPPAGAAPPPLPRLLAAEPVVADIQPGERHRYRLDLPSGRWVAIELAQREVDLDLTVRDEEGRVAASASTPGSWQDERLELITGPGAGSIVEVAAVPSAGRRGGYRLHVAEEREAGPDDEARREALALLRTIERPPPDAPARDPEEVEAVLRDLLANDRVAWSDEEAARILTLLANNLDKRQRTEEAIAAYRAGLARLAPGGPRPLTVHLLIALGDALGPRSADDAGEQLRRAVETARALGDPQLLALALNSEAAHLHDAGEPEAARLRLEEALEAARAAGDAPGEVAIGSNLSQILHVLGQPVAALARHEEAQRRADEMSVDDPGRKGKLLRNAGTLYRAAGELDRALDAFAQSLGIALAAGDVSGETSLGIYLGALLAQLGQYGDAREHLTRSALLAEETGNTLYHPSALLFLGWVALGEGEPGEAVELLERALAMPELRHRIEVSLLYALGVARMRLGQDAEAQSVLARVARNARDGGLLQVELDAHRALGTVHLEAGAFEEAAAELAAAHELATTIEDPMRQAAVESLLARLAAERGLPEAALGHALTAIELRESIRSRLADAELRTSFLARWRGDFDRAIEMRMALAAAEPAAGHDRHAFELSESAHARSLTELLAEADVELRPDVSVVLSPEEREVDRHLSLVETELAALSLRRAPQDADLALGRRDRETRLRRDRAMLRQRRAEVERKIRGGDPRYADIRFPQPPSVEQVQAWLPPRTALLEYALGERSSVLFVVTRDDFAAVALPSAGEIERRLEPVRRALERPPTLGAWRLSDGLAELTTLLVAPAADRLAAVNHLLVVPDGDLFYLPFEALGDPAAPERGAGGLLRRWAISYLPSAAVLPHLGREVTPVWERELLVFANPPTPSTAADGTSRGGLAPLPGSQVEAERIFELFPAGTVDLFLGDAAREGLLKQPGAAARRLHIASHGVISSVDAAESYVLLAPDPPEDGKLHLHEIFDLDLAAELVVLSGCETALGPQVAGEGLLGLARGFLYAGASDLVVSLWPVSDLGTEELMVDLYRRILAGRSIEEALRAAKLARLDDGVHPFLWAPFIVFGAPPVGATEAAPEFSATAPTAPSR